jgi:hypothetical protein
VCVYMCICLVNTLFRNFFITIFVFAATLSSLYKKFSFSPTSGAELGVMYTAKASNCMWTGDCIVCVYVCVDMYMCVYVHVCMCVCVCVSVYVCICTAG